MSRETQREWVRTKDNGFEKRGPVGCFMSPDGKFRSDRGVAGPLRLGTEPKVGPSGALLDGTSDWGMDRVTPRDFDPMGTSMNRTANPEKTRLISKEVRRYGKGGKD